MKTKTAVIIILLLLAGALWAEGIVQSNEQNFSISQEPREDKREAMIVAGLEVLDSMDPADMMKVWSDLTEHLPKLEKAIGNELYGITYYTEVYDPDSHKGFAYMAATEISSGEGIPENMAVRKISAANYLVFEHKGPVKYLGESYNYIYNKFMKDTKRTILFSEVLEVYGKAYNADDPDSADSIIEIWMPVKPLE